MAFVKKTWKDRASQYPTRRQIDDGNIVKTVYVSRAEGTVTEQGDAFNATNMNDLEQRIYNAVNNIQVPLIAGDNIDISASNVISVEGIMSANDAHAIWNNA